MTTFSPRPVGLTHPPLPVGLSADRIIRWFAARQHGGMARRQLLAAGLSGRQIDDRVARGVLTRVHRGVLSDSAAPLGHRARLLAAILAAPFDAVVSHRSAAELRGLLPETTTPVHVTTGGCLRGRGGIVVPRSSSHQRSTTVVDGVPCTSLPRTLVDVSATGGPLVVGRAWTTAAGRRALRSRAIEGELRRHSRRPGTPAVRALLERHREQVLGITRSRLEDAALAMCAEYGLPMPRVNALVETDDGIYEADLLWAAPRVVVELDDWATHGHVEAFHVDRDRDFDLELTGWRTLRLVYRDVTDDAARTADRLARFFELRLTELGRTW